MTDPHDLQRFVDAQDRDGTHASALAELRAGSKRGHWMWFVFPQITGLGRSDTARYYAVSGRDEAAAYLEHPVLGPRLVESGQALLDLGGNDAATVLGGIDAQKLHSSMTLFAAVAPAEPTFQAVLDRYFAGRLDDGTTSRL